MEQTFIAAEWEETGEIGYRPERCSEAFDPITYPVGLAHDFIEHAGNFTIEGEIMAHGAMFFGRYETGYCSPEAWQPLDLASIASEWINLYYGIIKEGCLNSCPASPKVDETVEEELAQIVSQGKRLVLQEIGREYLETDVYAALSQHFADWFRKGYSEAEERFSKIGRNGAVSAFEEVRQLFENRLKNELFGGERVTVKLDLDTGTVTFEQETECYSCGHYCDSDMGQCEDCIEYESEDEE